jgi:hypothetical protein
MKLKKMHTSKINLFACIFSYLFVLCDQVRSLTVTRNHNPNLNITKGSDSKEEGKGGLSM